MGRKDPNQARNDVDKYRKQLGRFTHFYFDKIFWKFNNYMALQIHGSSKATKINIKYLKMMKSVD